MFALDFQIIIPFGLGYIILAVTTAGMITYLFKNFYGMTYYAIIGFSLTSLVMFIPSFESNLQAVIGFIITLIAAILIYAITRMEDIMKKSKKNSKSQNNTFALEHEGQELLENNGEKIEDEKILKKEECKNKSILKEGTNEK